MIKRNTSLNRVEGLAEAFSQAPVSRRRSPVTKLVQQQQQQQALNETPPCSPKRGRSLSPSSRRPGGSSRGRQGLSAYYSEELATLHGTRGIALYVQPSCGTS
ncbi:unnamed protein product [Ectocarpus sp. 4 AP-2014]